MPEGSETLCGLVAEVVVVAGTGLIICVGDAIELVE